MGIMVVPMFAGPSTPTMLLRLALGCLIAGLLSACGSPAEHEDSLHLSEARIVLGPSGAPMAAGYFNLHNAGDEHLRLHGVTSADFASVDMHETRTVDGISRMRPLRELALPPDATIRFEPGGAHLMLTGATTDISKQRAVLVELQLVNASGEQQTLQASFALGGRVEPGSVARHNHGSPPH